MIRRPPISTIQTHSFPTTRSSDRWCRSLDPWWNLQAGVRHDFRTGPDRSYAVLGVQGLAPYWFEVDGALFLSDKGDVTARFEAEYDQRLTQKLIDRKSTRLNSSH